MAIDDLLKKAETETVRWYILQTLNAGRPLPVAESLIAATLNGADLYVTEGEIRRELDYLEGRRMVEVTKEQGGAIWVAHLTSLGVDVVEYTVDCRPGIARPPRR